MSVEKKEIPHPSAVPAKHHNKVVMHVAEQFGFTKTHDGHYSMKEGSVTVEPTGVDGEDRVSFIRVHDSSVPAAPHGLDLSE